MRVCQKRINLSCFLQVSRDGPNVKLKFLDILKEKQKNAEMKELIPIATCSLHTIHHGFQHEENASQWNLEKDSLCNVQNIP